MYKFHQDEIDITVCNNTAVVTFKDTTTAIKLRPDINLDEKLSVFPPKFREFAKKHIEKALSM